MSISEPFPTDRILRRIKGMLLVACLLPLARLIEGFFAGSLGANPVEAVLRGLGEWALIFLLLTLTVTPLRRLTGQHWLIRLRRMLGLLAFFYAALHVLAYLWAEHFFDWLAIGRDLIERPFITVGALAFALLVPLAVTSHNAMIRRLGGRRWQALHRLVYGIAVAAVVHYWWMVKLDITWPALYGAVLAVLLGVRLVWRLGSRPGALVMRRRMP